MLAVLWPVLRKSISQHYIEAQNFVHFFSIFWGLKFLHWLKNLLIVVTVFLHLIVSLCRELQVFCILSMIKFSHQKQRNTFISGLYFSLRGCVLRFFFLLFRTCRVRFTKKCDIHYQTKSETNNLRDLIKIQKKVSSDNDQLFSSLETRSHSCICRALGAAQKHFHYIFSCFWGQKLQLCTLANIRGARSASHTRVRVAYL